MYDVVEVVQNAWGLSQIAQINSALTYMSCLSCLARAECQRLSPPLVVFSSEAQTPPELREFN